MTITIEAEPKEVAALVVELQKRHDADKSDLRETIAEALKNQPVNRNPYV